MNPLRLAPNIRHAEVHYGDTLQRIALRELGDGGRWVELALLNELRPPYIDHAPAPGVLAYGDAIKIPAPSSGIPAESSLDALFFRDLKLRHGQLCASGGDLELLGGIPNFLQALTLHVTVEKKELAFHPSFGCLVRSLLGDIGGSRSGRLAAFYVKSAILEDPRVAHVESCVAAFDGDTIRVDATVVPISGAAVDLSLEV